MLKTIANPSTFGVANSNWFMLIRKELPSEIETIIAAAKERAIRSVGFERMRMYWNIGEKILGKQQGKEKGNMAVILSKPCSNDCSRSMDAVSVGNWNDTGNFAGLFQLLRPADVIQLDAL